MIEIVCGRCGHVEVVDKTPTDLKCRECGFHVIIKKMGEHAE